MRQVSGLFDPDILAVIKELKTYRMIMGISIREVAKRMNIDNSVLRRWERMEQGGRMPDMINLRLWAESLGCKIKVTIELPGE